MKYLLSLLIGVSLLSSVQAQSQKTSGKVEYEVKEVPAGQDPATVDPVEGAKVTYIFNDNLNIVESTYPANQYKLVSNSENGVMLVQAMGQKSAYTGNMNEFASYFDKDKPFELLTLEQETMTLNGLICQGVKMKFESGKIVTIYFTNVFYPMTQDFEFMLPVVEGIPMHIEISEGGKTTIYSATLLTEISEEDTSFFSLQIPEGYEQKEIIHLIKMKDAFERQSRGK